MLQLLEVLHSTSDPPDEKKDGEKAEAEKEEVTMKRLTVNCEEREEEKERGTEGGREGRWMDFCLAWYTLSAVV